MIGLAPTARRRTTLVALGIDRIDRIDGIDGIDGAEREAT
jgi:hypothetical protein